MASALTLLMVLASACLHAAWNARLRLESNKDAAVALAIIVGTCFASVIAAISWYWEGVPFPNMASLGYTVLAGLGEAVYFAALAKALRGPLGPVYTVSRAGAVLLVWPASVIIWAEPVNAMALAGAGILLAGLAVAGLGPSFPRRYFAWALICAVTIAAYHLAYKAALEHHAGAAASFAVSLALASVFNVLRLDQAARQAARTMWKTRALPISITGICCAGAFILLMYGLRHGGAGAVLTLRNTSVLFAMGFAAMIGDRPTRGQVIGGIFVAVGAVVLSLGAG